MSKLALLVFIPIIITINLSAQNVDTVTNANHSNSDTSKQLPVKLKNALSHIIDQNKAHENQPTGGLEINGLIIDETKTKNGRDFYDVFYSSFDATQIHQEYSITIEEKPFRGTLSFIEITLNDNLIYKQVLQPRYDKIEEMAKEAAAVTEDYLAKYNEIQQQLKSEDIQGTGIY